MVKQRRLRLLVLLALRASQCFQLPLRRLDMLLQILLILHLLFMVEIFDIILLLYILRRTTNRFVLVVSACTELGA